MSHRPVLGWSEESPLRRVLLVDRTAGAILDIAPVGSGKTGSCVMPNLVQHEGSIFGIDVKGQFTRNTALYRSAILKQETWVYDPMGVVEPKYLPKVDGQVQYAKLDPIAFIQRAKVPQAAADKFGQACIPPGTLNESHWSEAAQGYVGASALFVATDPLFEGFGLLRDVRSWWNLLSHPELEKALLKLMAQSDHAFIADQAAAFLTAGKDNREMHGIRSQIRVGCARTFGEERIVESMCGGNVDLSQFTRKRMSIYMVLPGDMAVTYKTVFRLGLMMLTSEVERSGVRPHDSTEPWSLVIADEFHTLGKFPAIVESLGRHREFGLKYNLLVQSLSQLQESYGEAWKTILGNASIIRCFGGTTDLLTAETISKLCGNSTVVTRGQNEPNGPGQHGGATYGTAQRPLMMPDEVMRLPLPKQIILPLGKKPVIGVLFPPDQGDFAPYRFFMANIEAGVDVNDAVRRYHLYIRKLHEQASA